jgi:hypothetical protein
MHIYLAIIEGAVGKFRTVTIHKELGAIKLFNNSDYINFNVQTARFYDLLNIQVFNCNKSLYPGENLEFCGDSAPTEPDNAGMLRFGLKITPLKQNQWCYMVVSWLTTRHTFVYVVSSAFVP